VATPTHYEVLGISSTATQDEIKEAYRRAVRTTHPDAGGTPGMFRLVMLAYETLRDPAQRAAYDAQLAGRRPHPGSDQGPSHDPGQGAGRDPEQDDEVDVDEHDPDWGTESVRNADVPRSPSPYLRDRVFAWSARSVLAHHARSVSWFVGPICYLVCVAVLVFPDLIRPDAAEPDVLSWLLQLPPLTLLVVAFYTFLARPLLVGVLEAFVLPHGLALLGFAAWPMAYWDIATGGERVTYGAFFAVFLLYLVALSIICIVNEADMEASPA